MSYFTALLTILFFSFPLYADDFERLNPKMTPEMLQSQAHAKLCDRPSVAKEKVDSSFRYGCFCGKGYPEIVHPSKKDYTKLNRKERRELIVQYYAVKPYDSIDEVCMKHDICYISHGRKDEVCNDAIYTTLRELQDIFSQNRKKSQCRVLASDISSYFKTIFAMGDNASIFRFGTRAMTTPITIASKAIQKIAHEMNSNSTYPLAGETCWISDINVSVEK